MPATLAGNLAGTGVVALLFWSLAPPPLLGGWLSAIVLMWAARLWMYRRFLRAQPATLAEWSRWRQGWNSARCARACCGA